MTMTRRDAIGAALGGAAALALTPAARARTAQDHAALGWDEGAGEYTLPDLPYAPEALEPHIDAQTMRIHHSKHHAGYVRKANEALRSLAQARDGSDPSPVPAAQRSFAFNFGGHVNHTLFWANMAPPDRAGEPSGGLLAAIERDFRTVRKFEWHFKQAAASVEGSGWGWLALEPMSGRLAVLQMENQQKLVPAGVVPLLGVDVWEHAYYLKYQNDRAKYLDAFWKVVNWNEVARRYALATGSAG